MKIVERRQNVGDDKKIPSGLNNEPSSLMKSLQQTQISVATLDTAGVDFNS